MSTTTSSLVLLWVLWKGEETFGSWSAVFSVPDADDIPGCMSYDCSPILRTVLRTRILLLILICTGAQMPEHQYIFLTIVLELF